jgi:glycosyltransferase involved in cell wall biosynthesis
MERLVRYGMPGGKPIIFFTMCRLLHWKGIHLSIRAFASAKIKQAEYWIFGDGPEENRLKALSRSLGVEDNVHFFGAVPREEVFDKLGKCHIFVYPSLHDSGGWACMEAMAAGRPVICLNLGGPATQVSGDSGFKIPAHNPEQAVKDMAEAMAVLADKPELRNYMGKAGRKKAIDMYGWEVKGRFFVELYRKTLSENVI